MKTLQYILPFFILNLLLCKLSNAQEVVVPLHQNTAFFQKEIKHFQSKKDRANLPFVDDFSYAGPYPDGSKWLDSQAYINNTMSADPISRGVATLDGLNAFGRPYYPQSFNSGLADSLTSVAIDLSSYDTSDHIYFSFFYQPQGVGFAPESTDSLFLYFKNNANVWVRMWEIRGNNYHGFKVVLLPVNEAQFFHAGFQFRFVNIASLNINDDVWNIDYVKIDVNRNDGDSIMNDVAFTKEPGSILKTYTSMPYRHFIANQANEKSSTQDIFIHNFNKVPNTITPNLEASELFSGTSLNTQNLSPVVIGAKGAIQQSFLSYNISYVPPSNKSKVVVRNKYFYPQVNSNDRLENDTIINDAVFDNYFAYDDGSAERAYFLLPAINFPAKTALQFTLNEADTLRGLMVHFGAQAPTALGKYFSIVLYKSLGALGQSDSIILQEDLFRVQYEPSYNGFSSYAFSSTPLLSAGTYYIGITQPANFGSDSIYYGLDVNTNSNSQQLSYNVDGTWYSSTISGSVMMRPIVGQEFVPTAVSSVQLLDTKNLSLFPNPVGNILYIDSKESIQTCSMYSLDGKLLFIQAVEHNQIDISRLHTGDYILGFTDKKGNIISKKINKL